MQLKAKINSKYLNEILSGRKDVEYRQFGNVDEMVLTDERGRSITMVITGMEQLVMGLGESVMAKHTDVNWDKEKPIFVIGLKPKRNSTKGLT